MTVTGKRDKRQGIRASLLYHVRNNPHRTRICSISKRKVLVWLGQKKNMVLRDTDPLVAQIQQILDDHRAQVMANIEASRPVKEAAERRAWRLLHDIVQSHSCLRIENRRVLIESLNGRQYAICLASGVVHRWDKKRGFICVFASFSYPGGGVLPLADRIIAKALTIAYAPRLINTL